MTIEPPKARYKQVADELRKAIKRGDYPPGTALPSQPELARQYGLNQTTIARAINVLRTEGLIRVEHGRGAWVQEIPTARRIRRIPRAQGGGSTFANEMRRLGLEPHTKLVEVKVGPVPEDVAEYLQIDEGTEVLIRKRHMFASGRPVQLATSYIPMSIAGDASIAEPDTGPTGMYQRLAERGYPPVRFVEEIEVRRPTDEEAAFLQLAEGQPVLSVVRIAYDKHDTPVESSVNVLAGHQWRLAYEWTADEYG